MIANELTHKSTDDMTREDIIELQMHCLYLQRSLISYQSSYEKLFRYFNGKDPDAMQEFLKLGDEL